MVPSFRKKCVCVWGEGMGLQEDLISDVNKKGLKGKRKILYKTQMPILNTDVSFL